MPPGTSLARTDALVQQVIPDHPGHARRVVGLRVCRHGRRQLQQLHELRARSSRSSIRSRSACRRGRRCRSIAAELRKRLSAFTAAEIRVVNPASVRGMGNAGGFQHDGRGPRRARVIARSRTRCSGSRKRRSKDPAISQAFSDFNTRNPTLDAVVDRDKAEMLGVPVRNMFGTLQTYLAGTYVNNINMLGHTFQVIAQGDASYRQDAGMGGAAEDALGVRRHGADQRDREAAARHRAVSRGALQPVSRRRHPGRHGRRPFVRRSDGRDGAHRARYAAGRHELRVDGHRLPAALVRRRRRARVRRSAWCSCSSSSRRCTRA